jgi:hypothetical protein
MKAAVAPAAAENRITFAELDGIRQQLASDDLDAEVRRGILVRLKNEAEAHEVAERAERILCTAPVGTYNEPLALAIKGLRSEEDGRERVRAALARAESAAHHDAWVEQKRVERLARWEALSPLERALYLVAKQTGNEAFVQVAKLAGDATTADPRHCPGNFEPTPQ